MDAAGKTLLIRTAREDIEDRLERWKIEPPEREELELLVTAADALLVVLGSGTRVIGLSDNGFVMLTDLSDMFADDPLPDGVMGASMVGEMPFTNWRAMLCELEERGIENLQEHRER